MMEMLKNVLCNLAGGPSTRPYPVEQRLPFKEYRGIIYNKVDGCIFCGMCQRLCPTDAITIDAKTGLWTYDPFLCVYCSACVDKCPTECLKQENVHRKPSTEKFIVQKRGTPPQKREKPLKAAKK